MSLGAMDVIQQYEQSMAAAVAPQDDLFGGGLKPTTTRALRRPSADSPWAPSGAHAAPAPAGGQAPPAIPRASGSQRRAALSASATTLPHLGEASPTSGVGALALPPELAARFRTLCALRAADPARVIEGLVRSYVILGLAQGGGR